MTTRGARQPREADHHHLGEEGKGTRGQGNHSQRGGILPRDEQKYSVRATGDTASAVLQFRLFLRGFLASF